MLFVKAGNTRLPIFSWCADVEEKAMWQATNLANHPATFHHVAIMPDCHSGYGMPIGGVIACEDAVVPNAVGVDIGCGVSAVKLGFFRLDEENVRNILSGIKRRVPVGFAHQEENQEWIGFDYAPDVAVVRDQLAAARKQLGTLGGGNHFIEIQAGPPVETVIGGIESVWLMVHSGSRNFGLKIAKHFNDQANRLCTRWHSSLPPGNGEDSLAFLPIGDRHATDYILAMAFALDFARENRKRILDVAIEEVQRVVGDDGRWLRPEPGERFDVHHNYATVENHFGHDVWVHRKGATSARAGEIGIIPGSMGTASYIVRGLGNRDSFESCSHGAGRASGRAEFNRTHTLEECEESMKGIVFDGWDEQKARGESPDLSEAPGAYKDICEVMAAQADLVEIVTELTPLGVVKG